MEGTMTTMDPRARLAAVEALLTDPEELHMDPLEGDLYVLQDRLRDEVASPLTGGTRKQ
jgi:hypothetical protein